MSKKIISQIFSNQGASNSDAKVKKKHPLMFNRKHAARQLILQPKSKFDFVNNSHVSVSGSGRRMLRVKSISKKITICQHNKHEINRVSNRNSF